MFSCTCEGSLQQVHSESDVTTMKYAGNRFICLVKTAGVFTDIRGMVKDLGYFGHVSRHVLQSALNCDRQLGENDLNAAFQVPKCHRMAHPRAAGRAVGDFPQPRHPETGNRPARPTPR